MTQLTEKLDALYAALAESRADLNHRLVAQMALIIQHSAPVDFMLWTPRQIAEWVVSQPPYSEAA